MWLRGVFTETKPLSKRHPQAWAALPSVASRLAESERPRVKDSPSQMGESGREWRGGRMRGWHYKNTPYELCSELFQAPLWSCHFSDSPTLL